MGDQNKLYTDLRAKTYSVKEFTNHSGYLYRRDTEQFIRFNLTGEVPDDHQAVVDPLRNCLDPEHRISVARDYDSILGITDDIAVDFWLSIYPVNNPIDALKTSIHLKHDIVEGQVGISVTLASKY
jgi:hypothetical protein